MPVTMLSGTFVRNFRMVHRIEKEFPSLCDSYTITDE